MDTERTAEDVFRLLSDEIRLEVLEAVAVAQHEEFVAGPNPLSFSEIYERVDVDSTSKLSYHLGELTGTFLRKHGGGYLFTQAGEQLVRFVLAENYESPSAFGTIETEGQCLFCGETALEATQDDQFFLVQCSDCARPVYSYRIRPAQVRSHDGSDLIDTVVWEQAADCLKMRQGVCPDCAGNMTTEILDVNATEGAPDGVPASFGTKTECQQCLRSMSLPLTHAVAFHPESVAFHWEHGIDIMGTGLWEFHSHLHDGLWRSERVDDGPATYRVTLQADATSLRLFVDERGMVTHSERVRRRDQHERRS